MTGTAVRPATRSDRAAVGRVLGRAFQVDPVYEWLFPDPARRARRLPGLMRAFARMHAGAGALEVATVGGVVTGVAVWDGPGHVELPASRTAVGLPGMLRATGRDLPRLAELGATLDAARPTEPHWYLFHLAADPDAQGRGIGSALLASVLPRCDVEGLGAYLECKPDNVAYYERAGFHVSGEVTVAGELTVLTMWRPSAPG